MAGGHVFSFFSHSAWLTNELSSGHSVPRHDCSQPRDVINTEGPSPGAWVLHFLMLIVIPLTTLRRDHTTGHTGLQKQHLPISKTKTQRCYLRTTFLFCLSYSCVMAFKVLNLQPSSLFLSPILVVISPAYRQKTIVSQTFDSISSSFDLCKQMSQSHSRWPLPPTSLIFLSGDPADCRRKLSPFEPSPFFLDRWALSTTQWFKISVEPTSAYLVWLF